MIINNPCKECLVFPVCRNRLINDIKLCKKYTTPTITSFFDMARNCQKLDDYVCYKRENNIDDKLIPFLLGLIKEIFDYDVRSSL